MEKKLQIRQINDIHGNQYKIYDIMVKTKVGLWKSVGTFDTIEDAIRWNSEHITIEDLTID